MRVAIITSSDSGYAGEREDKSGPVIAGMVTAAVCERMVPGIPEAMRAYSMQFTPRAMLSRAASGIRKRTLIVNMPGSPKAVRESLEFILPSLGHGLEILTGEATNCART